MFNLIKQTGITFICTLVFVFTFPTLSLQAATLHAILVGDTNDQALGKAMRLNIENIYEELSKAAELTDLELNVMMNYGKSTNRKQVLEQIEQLEIDSDDVVIAFFSMHGFRTHDKETLWPDLFFGEDYKGVEFDYVINNICKKNPRLLIAMADSCNAYIKANQIKTLRSLGFSEHFSSKYEKDNYKKLFLESSGVIIASGALPGTKAWGVNSAGTFMTMGFVDSLQDVVCRKSNVSWEEVFSQLEIRINDYITIYGSKHTQTPQYVIDLH